MLYKKTEKLSIIKKRLLYMEIMMLMELLVVQYYQDF